MALAMYVMFGGPWVDLACLVLPATHLKCTGGEHSGVNNTFSCVSWDHGCSTSCANAGQRHMLQNHTPFLLVTATINPN